MIQAAPWIALAVAIACGTAYVKGRQDGKELSAATAAREELVAAKAADAAASAAASAIQKIRIQNTTVQQKVEREIQTRTVYRECSHPPGVRDTINEALTGRAVTPASAGVSATDAAGR